MLTYELTDEVRAEILAHAEQEQPRECCGLLLRLADRGLAYFAGRNVYEGTAGEDRFELDPDTWMQCEGLGEVVGIVHSHPNASANPSMADRRMCERTKLPWLIVGWPSGVLKELQPCGWVAPYKGRTFHHGVLDCYTLVQDWYVRELGIELPDIERADEWWKKPGQDLYMQHFTAAGFVPVTGEPQRHDVLLIQVKADVANHGAIYQGNGVILHHLVDRLSCEDVYGGYWQRQTLAMGRHISQVKP